MDVNKPVRKQRKARVGSVISDKMDKTVVVAVEVKVRHEVYSKVVSQTSKVVAHDEKNECSVGDIVEIMETRPMSARKRWRVTSIVRKAE